MTAQQLMVAGSTTGNTGFNNYAASWSETITQTAFGSCDGQFNGLTILSLLYNTAGQAVFLILPGTLPQSFFTSIAIYSATGPSAVLKTYVAADADEFINDVDSDNNPITVFAWQDTGGSPFTSGARYLIQANNDESLTVGMNCQCMDTNNNETLAALRRRMLVRLGYSAQADNPPPGMADLLDDFLRSEQKTLYLQYKALRTERLFRWTLTPNIRFYDFDSSDTQYGKILDPLTVTWVGLQDLNNVWFDMKQGIPPAYYTSVVFPGYPSRYEFRGCIEIFPAPSAAYHMWVKGRFGLDPLVADTDKTTIDSEVVFLHALAMAKAHYNQADASTVGTMATRYLNLLVKGGHQTARYVPGTQPSAPWTKPHFLPLDNP